MAIRKGSSCKERPSYEKSVGDRAFDHALDIELMIVERMDELGMRKKDLANKLGMSASGLSNVLNTQPNMTLETLTRFEVALDAVFEIELRPRESYEYAIELRESEPAGDAGAESGLESQQI